MMDKQAIDIIEAIEKRCRIARILYDEGHLELIPTVVEDIFMDAQSVISYCIVDET